MSFGYRQVLNARFVIFSIFCASLLSAAVPGYIGLPDRAVVLEEQPLPAWAHAHRALLLWVLAPPDKPLQGRTLTDDTDSSPEEDYDYTCPEQTRGHFYTAPARVSLVDTKSRHVLNTVPLKFGDADEYDVPFRIRPGFFYEVRGPLKSGAGRVHILALHDLNRDGKALEFALHNMESCSGPLTLLLGYSQRQDRVIIYQFLLGGEPTLWMYRFTYEKPVDTMHWRYQEWYNSGVHEVYDFRYIPAKERFEGTVLTSNDKDPRR